MTLLKSGTELEHLTAVTLQRFKVKMLDIKDTESKVKVSLKLQCISVVTLTLSSYRFSTQLENVAIVMHCNMRPHNATSVILCFNCNACVMFGVTAMFVR